MNRLALSLALFIGLPLAVRADTTVTGSVLLSDDVAPGAFTVEGYANGKSVGTCETKPDGQFAYNLPDTPDVKRVSLIISKASYRSNVVLNLITKPGKNKHTIAVELRHEKQSPESSLIRALIQALKQNPGL